MTDTTALARQLAALEEAAAGIAEQIKQTRAALLDALPPGGTADVDGKPLYKAMPGKRTFKQDLAAKNLPPDIAAAATRSTIDGAALKHLSPALWESCCTTGAPYLQAVR